LKIFEYRLAKWFFLLWQKFGGCSKALNEAKKAHDMGYPLCLCTYPPTIMRQSQSQGEFACEHCNKIETLLKSENQSN